MRHCDQRLYKVGVASRGGGVGGSAKVSHRRFGQCWKETLEFNTAGIFFSLLSIKMKVIEEVKLFTWRLKNKVASKYLGV